MVAARAWRSGELVDERKAWCVLHSGLELLGHLESGLSSAGAGDVN